MSKKRDEEVRKLITSRIMEVIGYIKDNTIAGIKSEAAFMRAIGVAHMSSITQIKNGAQGFTLADILAICDKFNIDANFIFSEGHVKMFREQENLTAMQKLKEAVIELDLTMKQAKVLKEKKA